MDFWRFRAATQVYITGWRHGTVVMRSR